jgi:hypothetical protein
MLALALPMSGASAQATPAPAAAVDPATIQALKNMGAHLQSLQRFRVTNELTGERVLSDGQKLQHMASAAVDVQRPNRLHVTMSSARSQRELFYDGKQVTLFTPAQKYYATVGSMVRSASWPMHCKPSTASICRSPTCSSSAHRRHLLTNSIRP